MTTPVDPERGQPPSEPVELSKEPSKDAPAEPEPAFDPYRFGKPDHPIPAEYAPPGYTGPVIPAGSGGSYDTSPYGSVPYGADPTGTGNPFASPPGTPYGAGPSTPDAGQPNPYQPGPYQPGPYQPGQSPFPGQQPYGYPPYGPGVPAPPPYHGYAQPRSGNGKAIAALVLGILSILLCWLTIFDAVLVILALIFGFIALHEAKQGTGSGRGMAIAGLVCTVVGALFATIITVKVFSAINDCGGLSQANSNNSNFSQCVKDNF